MLRFAAAIVALSLAAVAPASAATSEPAYILVDADSGAVIAQDRANQPWYPASVTKLMTTYVTLKAVKERRISLDSLITVSANAASHQQLRGITQYGWMTSATRLPYRALTRRSFPTRM